MAGHSPDTAQWSELVSRANFRVLALAQALGISPRQLRRESRELFGRTPHWLCNRARLVEAEERLARGDPIKEVAWSLHFTDSAGFCHWFKAQTDLTPAQFAASARVDFSI